jgi:hypothetical protein
MRGAHEYATLLAMGLPLFAAAVSPAFRKRFAVEMLELAEAAEAREWTANLRRHERGDRALLAAAGGNQFDGGARRAECLPGAGGIRAYGMETFAGSGPIHGDHCRSLLRWFARQPGAPKMPLDRG